MLSYLAKSLSSTNQVIKDFIMWTPCKSSHIWVGGCNINGCIPLLKHLWETTNMKSLILALSLLCVGKRSTNQALLNSATGNSPPSLASIVSSKHASFNPQRKHAQALHWRALSALLLTSSVDFQSVSLITLIRFPCRTLGEATCVVAPSLPTTKLFQLHTALSKSLFITCQSSHALA